MDVRDVLRNLPHAKGVGEPWFESEKGYPWHSRVMCVLEPRKYVEYGSRFGSSIIAALEGAMSIEEIAWVTGESDASACGHHCDENIEAYLSKVGRQLNRRHVPTSRVLKSLPADSLIRLSFYNPDVACINCERAYGVWRRDLWQAELLASKVIVLSGCLSDEYPELPNMVAYYARKVGWPYCMIPSYSGLAVFDYRELPGQRPPIGAAFETAGLPVLYSNWEL